MNRERTWTAYIPLMRTFLLTTILLAATIGAAEARGGHGFIGMPPGSIGNAGRMPETMSPGALRAGRFPPLDVHLEGPPRQQSGAGRHRPPRHCSAGQTELRRRASC